MTDEEALALREGAQVEARDVAGRWYVVRVMAVGRAGGSSYVYVQTRRPGVNMVGRRYHSVRHYPHELRALPDLDRAVANVYADFLEEHGEYTAAALLREAFPLADALRREEKG